MPATDRSLELVSFDYERDDALDLISLDQTGIHIRFGDGTGTFGSRVDVAYPGTRSGPAHMSVGDVIAVAVTISGGTEVALLENDRRGSFVTSGSVAIPQDEQVLAVAVVSSYLVVLVESTSGRALRRWRRDSGFPATGLATTGPVLADLEVPIRWSGERGTTSLVAATSATHALGSMTRFEIGLAATATYYGPVGAEIVVADDRYTTSSVGAFSSRSGETSTSEPAASNAGRLNSYHASELFGYVTPSRSLTLFYTEGATDLDVEPVLVPAGTTMLHGADLDRDGLTDLVLADGNDVIVMHGRGDSTP